MAEYLTKQSFEFQQRPEASLFTLWVTSPQLHDLETPKLIDDFANKELFFKKHPFAKLLLDRGLPMSTLLSILKCGSKSPTDKLLKCECGCGVVFGEIRHHCSNRSCPKCSKRRQRKIYRKYFPLVRNLVSTPTYSLKFLTISPKNYRTLQEGVENVRSSIVKMLRRKYFKDRILSGIYVIEAKNLNKFGESLGWNVHVHLLIYSRYLTNYRTAYCFSCKRKQRVKYDRNSEKYYCSVKSCNSTNLGEIPLYSPLNIEVRKAFKRDLTTDVKLIRDRQSPHGYFQGSSHILNYCLKYISVDKSDFASSSDFADYIVYTTGKPLIHTFGLFYGKTNDPLRYECRVCGQIPTYSLSTVCEAKSSVPPPL